MTYGQLAIILGEGYTARTVGYVMHGSPDDVPWQRVINSQGNARPAGSLSDRLQQELLEPRESCSVRGEIRPLGTFQWFPKSSRLRMTSAEPI